MHFMRAMDEMKNQTIEKILGNSLNEFHFYKEIEILDLDTKNKFICLKRQYSNFLIQEENNRKVYLSDYDIVLMLIDILNNSEDIGNLIMTSMYNLVKSEGEEYSFKLADEVYVHEGLAFLNEEVLINTKADFEISVNDFIAIINLVAAKEEISSNKNSVKDILCKYICLVEYYRSKDGISKEILIKSDYDTELSLEQSEYYIARAGKKKFVVDTNIFLKLKNI